MQKEVRPLLLNLGQHVIGLLHHGLLNHPRGLPTSPGASEERIRRSRSLRVSVLTALVWESLCVQMGCGVQGRVAANSQRSHILHDLSRAPDGRENRVCFDADLR